MGLVAFTSSPSQAADATASISGKVTGPDNKALSDRNIEIYQQVGGSWVQLDREIFSYYDKYGGQPAKTGTYSVTGLEPGTYTLGFNEATPYNDNRGLLATSFYGGSTTLSAATSIVLADGEKRTGVDARLTYLGGTISGTVKDAAGKPIGFAEVYAIAVDREFEAEQSPLYAGGIEAVTDTNGRFTVRTRGVPVKLRFDQDSGGYATEFYDDTRVWEDATELTATTGHDLTGIEVNLAPKQIVNQSLPRVRGNLFNGGTATADRGEWSHNSATYTYRWFRSGSTTPVGTGATHKISSASIGKTLSVEVTAHQTGVQDVVVTSPQSAVVKRASTVTFTASSPSRGKVTFKVSLAVTGVSKPSGKVKISCSLASRTVSVSKGKVTSTLSGLPSGGKLSCKAESVATSTVAADSSPSRSIKVK